MPLPETLGLVLLALVAWYWLEAVRARDIAVEAAREACLQQGLQLLDESVVRRSLGFTRDEDGRVCIRQMFDFEFTDDGLNRRPGQVVITCGIATSVYTGPVLLKDIA